MLAHFARLGKRNTVRMFSRQIVTVPAAVLHKTVPHQPLCAICARFPQLNTFICSSVFASWIARVLQHYSKCTYFGKQA